MRLRQLSLAFAAAFLATLPFASLANAQDKGEPGHFDFYLMNLSWSPEFCSIRGTSPECAAHPGFILHGLWTQNNDGTYPVFCSAEPAPANIAQNLDITPDLALLHHEWDKLNLLRCGPAALLRHGASGLPLAQDSPAVRTH